MLFFRCRFALPVLSSLLNSDYNGGGYGDGNGDGTTMVISDVRVNTSSWDQGSPAEDDDMDTSDASDGYYRR